MAAPDLASVEQLSQQETARIAAKAEGRVRLESQLQRWSDSSEGYVEHSVIDRILEAYDSDSAELFLGGLELTSIPPLTELTKLERLSLSDNKLASLETLQAGENLKELDVGFNPLLSLPSDLGERVPALEHIDISRTLVSKLPPDIILPPGIKVVAQDVEFLTRESVRIILQNTGSSREDHEITDDHYLPSAQGRARGRVGRGLDYQRLANRARQAGVDANKVNTTVSNLRQLGVNPTGSGSTSVRPSKITSSTSLEQNLTFYYQTLGREVPPQLLERLKAPLPGTGQKPTDNQTDNLKRDLWRFTAIKDALTTPEKTEDLARRVVAIIDSAIESDLYREHLFDVAGDASSKCEDRAAVGLSQLEQEAYLFKAISRDPVDTAEIRQLFRETAIYESAQTFALQEGFKQTSLPADQVDQIEWVLSYLTVLRDRGHLSFGSSDLHYRHAGGFEVAKVQADIPKILERADGSQAVKLTLQRVPTWVDKLADLWPPFKTEKAALEAKFEELAIEIEDESDAGHLTQDEYGAAYNRWGVQKTDALALLVEKHTEQWLAAQE